jgi:hypothetical protein
MCRALLCGGSCARATRTRRVSQITGQLSACLPKQNPTRNRCHVRDLIHGTPFGTSTIVNGNARLVRMAEAATVLHAQSACRSVVSQILTFRARLSTLACQQVPCWLTGSARQPSGERVWRDEAPTSTVIGSPPRSSAIRFGYTTCTALACGMLSWNTAGTRLLAGLRNSAEQLDPLQMVASHPR